MAIVLTHALACTAVILAAINGWVQLAILATIAVSLFANLYQHTRPVLLVWRAGNHWLIDDGDKESQSSQLKGIDFFSRWLVIITLKSKSGRAKRYIIVYDALTEDKFRLLRVRLRVEGFQLLNPDQPTNP